MKMRRMMLNNILRRGRRLTVGSALTMALATVAGMTFFAARSVRADGAAAFDLSGPRVEMKVMRAGKTLPIANVPNLQAGDRLWVHPDFPDSQSVHFLVVIAFLRGATNPPPENWFTKAEAWNKQVREEGFFVTVPQGAQQALLFLAPETGGDYGSLRATVRGKPGIFVRASQDLNQARRCEKAREWTPRNCMIARCCWRVR
jgi:hypothetical protein